MMTLQDTLRRLAKRRLALCMTWAELAKASGVAEYTIRCWFDPSYCPAKKHRVPRLDNLIAVANTLGFTYRLEPMMFTANDNINIWRQQCSPSSS